MTRSTADTGHLCRWGGYSVISVNPDILRVWSMDPEYHVITVFHCISFLSWVGLESIFSAQALRPSSRRTWFSTIVSGVSPKWVEFPLEWRNLTFWTDSYQPCCSLEFIRFQNGRKQDVMKRRKTFSIILFVC